MTGLKAGATADEVDDLEAVALLESGLRPAVAGDDIAVELYGNAVGFHAELVEQRGKGELGWEIALFPVNVKLHGVIFACRAGTPMVKLG